VDSTVYLFADDTKMYRKIETIEDIQKLQIDLSSLDQWSTAWLLKFHPEKCMVMRLGHHDPKAEYHLGPQNTKLLYTHNEKDLGVHIDDKLKFKQDINIRAKKANQIVGTIRRTFDHLDNNMFCKLFKSLVRPHLEYGAAIWNPQYMTDITTLEQVQRRATKLLPGFSNLTYEQRLRELDLPSLRFRRTRGDMIEIYKLFNVYDSTTGSILTPANERRTRGNSLKLFKQRAASNRRKNFLSIRAAENWNNLPENVVAAPSLNSFKNRLDKYWRKHPQRYDWTATHVHDCIRTGLSTAEDLDIEA